MEWKIWRSTETQIDENVIAEIEAQPWGAAHFLADLMKNTLTPTLGAWAEVHCLVDGDKLVCFATLSEQDCIADKTLSPWMGFLYTVPTYRKMGYARQLVDRICRSALEKGCNMVYVATDLVGFYEKLGFEYSETRTDVWNEPSRIYCKNLI